MCALWRTTSSNTPEAAALLKSFPDRSITSNGAQFLRRNGRAFRFPRRSWRGTLSETLRLDLTMVSSSGR
jgi:hypothetical protein